MTVNQVLKFPHCFSSNNLAVANKSAFVCSLCIGAIVAIALATIGAIALAGILTLPMTVSASLLGVGLLFILSLALISLAAVKGKHCDNEFGPFVECSSHTQSNRRDECIIDMEGLSCSDCPFCEDESHETGSSHWKGLCFAEEFGCSRCICPSCDTSTSHIACSCSICCLGQSLSYGPLRLEDICR